MRVNTAVARALVAAALGVFSSSAWAALAPYSGLVTANSPKVYLQLDETSGTVAADSGSNGVAGTYGSVTLGQPSAAAVLGTSFFNPTLDTTATAPVLVNIGTGANSPSSIGTGPFSVEFWFKTPTVDDRQDLMDMNGGAGSDFGIHLLTSGGATPTNRVRVFHISDTIPASASTTASTGAWHHLVYTRDGANVATLYLDGASVATGTDAQTLTSAAPFLGIAQKSTGTLNRAFQGNMDEFAFYGSALSPAEVGLHYNAVVPEPTSLALVGCGALMLLARRRRTTVR